jgi:hypothetical protein
MLVCTVELISTARDARAGNWSSKEVMKSDQIRHLSEDATRLRAQAGRTVGGVCHVTPQPTPGGRPNDSKHGRRSVLPLLRGMQTKNRSGPGRHGNRSRARPNRVPHALNETAVLGNVPACRRQCRFEARLRIRATKLAFQLTGMQEPQQ